MYKGHKIHATCKKTYIESKGSLLPVGAWRYIRNFHVRPAGGAYRTTNHAYKIVFNPNTNVTRSNFMNDELYLNLVDFQLILSGTLDDKLLIGKYISYRFLKYFFVLAITNIFCNVFLNRCAWPSFGLW